MKNHIVFVARFASGLDGGIQALQFDPETGILSPGARSGDGQVFFLAASGRPDRLYSLRAEKFNSPEHAEEVVAWEITGDDGALREIGRACTHGLATCYLSADPDGRFLLAANYTGGSLVSFPLDAHGVPGEAASVIRLEGSSVHPRQTSPHPHSFLSIPGDGGTVHAYAADLGSDRIFGFIIDPGTAQCVPMEPEFCAAAPGSGPRHLVAHPGGRFLYAIDELSNTVTPYARDTDTGALTRRQPVSSLPADFSGESFGGDMAISPCGGFLYATNRGHDSIAVFRIEADGELVRQAAVPSSGKGPQNLAFTPDGRWLLCANLPAGQITVFRVAADGLPVAAGQPFAVVAPSCLLVR